MPWTCSAHAKDIWTSPDWELADKLAAARWTVTCTQTGYEHLRALAAGASHVHLSYHGLDLDRFGRFAGERADARRLRPGRPGASSSASAARSRRRATTSLLEALALLPADLALALRAYRRRRGAADAQGAGRRARHRRSRRLGARWRRRRCLRTIASADIFALACRIAADGDRDGLPNVLVEAASQRLACVSTDISGVPELLDDGENGLVVPPDDPQALAEALERAIRDPALRHGSAMPRSNACARDFDHHASIGQLDGPVRAGVAERAMSGAARLLLCPASARHRPSGARQPDRRRARRGRVRVTVVTGGAPVPGFPGPRRRARRRCRRSPPPTEGFPGLSTPRASRSTRPSRRAAATCCSQALAEIAGRISS